jgi:hypothetical protein
MLFENINGYPTPRPDRNLDGSEVIPDGEKTLTLDQAAKAFQIEKGILVRMYDAAWGNATSAGSINAMLDNFSPIGIEVLRVVVDYVSLTDRVRRAGNAAPEGDLKNRLDHIASQLSGDPMADVFDLLERHLIKPDTAFANAINESHKAKKAKGARNEA